MNMEDDLRNELVPIPEKQMLKLADICNRYPLVEIKFETDRASKGDPVGSYAVEEPIELLVTLSRDEDEDDEEALAIFNQPVKAQYYPEKKSEEWWVVVGHSKTGKLLAIKKVTTFKAQAAMQTKLTFQVSEAELSDSGGEANLKIYLICDSYIGCDLQEDLRVKVSPAQ